MSAGCRPKESSEAAARRTNSLPSWPRQSFEPTQGRALIWYQIYGHFPDTVEISQGKYRCSGVPDGVELQHHQRTDPGDLVTSFLKQPFFAAGLKRSLPALAGAVDSAPECTIIRGEVPDSNNLDYLRDVVGFVTWFLDNGGLAVLDPQTFRWYGREQWRGELFDSNGTNLRQHVVILYSEELPEKDLLWFHTRGMRKFARPDLSVHRVPAQDRDAVIDLLNQLIELQASGRIIADGKTITMQSLPGGIVCSRTGSLDDPDFNNTHVELHWSR
jgi:hypothetical protein